MGGFTRAAPRAGAVFPPGGAETPPMHPCSPPALRAVVFDVDGTLSDTERDGHRPAFNAAFRAHGLPHHWDPDAYGALLDVPGGRQRIAAHLRAHGHPDAGPTAAAVHRTKTAVFRAMVLDGRCAPRPGVRALADGLVELGVRIGVATTGSRAWVEPLVEQVLGAGTADVVVTGEDVTALKPHPAAYLVALRCLGVDAEEALAVEDSAIGLCAAVAAGVTTVCVPTAYTRHQDLSRAAAVLPGFDRPHTLTAQRCQALHRRAWSAGQCGR